MLESNNDYFCSIFNLSNHILFKTNLAKIDYIMTRPTKQFSKIDIEKDEVLTGIEDESRNGIAFDDKTVSILKKLTVADLFYISIAFHQSYKFGIQSVEE